jgi:hypothetical protein
LVSYASKIVDDYVVPAKQAYPQAKARRSARSKKAEQNSTQSTFSQSATSAVPSTASTPVGDQVFEGAILFLRDALILREYTDAIKIGDPGRIILVLKHWCFAFRGSGKTKYSYEMLSLIHHIEKVWPKPLV